MPQVERLTETSEAKGASSEENGNANLVLLNEKLLPTGCGVLLGGAKLH